MLFMFKKENKIVKRNKLRKMGSNENDPVINAMLTIPFRFVVGGGGRPWLCLNIEHNIVEPITLGGRNINRAAIRVWTKYY